MNSGESFRPLFSPPERVVDSLEKALELDRSLSGGHDAKSLAKRSGQVRNRERDVVVSYAEERVCTFFFLVIENKSLFVWCGVVFKPQGIYGLMCIVNYCRSMQLAGKSSDEIIQAVVSDNHPFCASSGDALSIERWITPVNDGAHDALLQELLDSFDEEFGADDDGGNDAAVANVTSEAIQGHDYPQASGLLKPGGGDAAARLMDSEDRSHPEVGKQRQ